MSGSKGSVQLFGLLDEANRGQIDAKVCYNPPKPGSVPTMDEFIADYASMLLFEQVVHPGSARLESAHLASG